MHRHRLGKLPSATFHFAFALMQHLNRLLEYSSPLTSQVKFLHILQAKALRAFVPELSFQG